MRIRVIKTPCGNAPKSIRQQWVGIEMDVDPDGDDDSLGWDTNDQKGGYIINIDEALEALRNASKDEAVEFWEQMRADTVHHLRFGTEFCVVV